MNTEDKIAEQAAEIDRLGLVLAERQAKIGQLMGEAARAGIAGAPAGVANDELVFLNAAKDFAQAHINCDEIESAYESDPESGSEADTAEVDGMYNVTKKRLVEAYRALNSVASPSPAPAPQQEPSDKKGGFQ